MLKNRRFEIIGGILGILTWCGLLFYVKGLTCITMVNDVCDVGFSFRQFGNPINYFRDILSPLGFIFLLIFLAVWVVFGMWIRKIKVNGKKTEIFLKISFLILSIYHIIVICRYLVTGITTDGSLIFYSILYFLISFSLGLVLIINKNPSYNYPTTKKDFVLRKIEGVILIIFGLIPIFLIIADIIRALKR